MQHFHFRYIHKELKLFYEGNVIHSIFEEAGDCHKLKIKDHVTLHLYMSKAPCGDAIAFTHPWVYYSSDILINLCLRAAVVKCLTTYWKTWHIINNDCCVSTVWRFDQLRISLIIYRHYCLIYCSDDSDITAEDLELMESGIHYPTFSNDTQGLLRIKADLGEKIFKILSWISD